MLHVKATASDWQCNVGRLCATTDGRFMNDGAVASRGALTDAVFSPRAAACVGRHMFPSRTMTHATSPLVSVHTAAQQHRHSAQPGSIHGHRQLAAGFHFHLLSGSKDRCSGLKSCELNSRASFRHVMSCADGVSRKPVFRDRVFILGNVILMSGDSTGSAWMNRTEEM